ncbi:uncharacterized protein OCT59_014862 [Rhizophagus irregularis]|uniref:uncharacterized protein n=1 Tax=Rhizophagus irregularis TaxID=588596 RepID=UPI0019FC15B3|nr:hypothetical protein OCT59_014862 [Rhizophagus irregularis]GET55037.1 hypothetical protein RIR_jg14999.t1 [Rhizophagus irregularis DAOM 181602=DAOM 197198]
MRIRRPRRQRISNRIYRRRFQPNIPFNNEEIYGRRTQPNIPFNNEETLRRIENLPLQQITNNSPADQFFNGIIF